MALQLFRFENCLDDASISARHQNISMEDEEVIVVTAAASAIINKTALMNTVLCIRDDDKHTRGMQKIRRKLGCSNPILDHKENYVCQKEIAAMFFNSVQRSFNPIM